MNNEGSADQTAGRKLGVGLIIGIILIPFIFAWFTLRQGHSTGSRIFAFGWLILGLTLVGMQESDTPTHGGPNAIALQQKTPSIVATLRAPQLVAAYDSNEVAADNKFKGQYVKVSGSIEDIGKDLMDDIYISLDGGGVDEMGLRSVQAFFSDSDSGKIAALKKGTQVTLVCRVDGLMMNVLLKDCVIE